MESKENLALSEINKLSTKLSDLEVILTISASLTETKIGVHELSVKSIVSNVFNSQGRALKAYKREVKAPTGHKSITLPEILDAKIPKV